MVVGEDKLLSKRKPVTLKNKIYMSIIEEETGAYFADQKTLDEVIEIIQNRIILYISENKDE